MLPLLRFGREGGRTVLCGENDAGVPTMSARPRWLTLALGLTAAVALAGPAPAADATAPRPHVVVFLSDDQGWGDVGWHGSDIKTPNLDKLAAAGARLEQFYVQPVCSPTRAAFMTGR